jgi:hypothetical protein
LHTCTDDYIGYFPLSKSMFSCQICNRSIILDLSKKICLRNLVVCYTCLDANFPAKDRRPCACLCFLDRQGIGPGDRTDDCKVNGKLGTDCHKSFGRPIIGPNHLIIRGRRGARKSPKFPRAQGPTRQDARHDP